MKESVIEASLAEAGLIFMGMVAISDPLIPPDLATRASSCFSEELTLAESVYLDDPLLLEKANREWYRMSREGGLFGEGERKFLVAVNCADGDSPQIWWWAKAELSDPWDIMGAGAASGALGAAHSYPGFVMLSLDGDVIVRGDRGEVSIDLTVVREPHRLPIFLRHGEWLAAWPDTDEFTRAALKRWLEKARSREL
ncbi:hypothetical protein [Streptosporangium carneum]|uniref:Uncharacterized protein n=1 Tax=Streptosporangium carneum TaxID=47481 RepID=A0A9W6I0B1_9ACTN|nr:hypothetical protein [Streptosporangium carneum]GLK09660.1 hypothetical protein GCM10017600_30660 [Streptosporangium carneum]